MRARAVLAIACVLTLAGCKLNTDYFKDYRGKNLLANWDFGALDASSNPKWALESYSDYATSTSTDYDATYTTSDYMSWATASDLNGVLDSTSGHYLNVGPNGTSPAYRLEIKNLFNDGDFESASNNATISDSWWSPQGSATALVYNGLFTSQIDASLHPSPISNQSMFFSGPAGSEMTLTLSTSSVPLWNRPGSYRFRFDYRYFGTSQTFHAALTPATNTDAENTGAWDATGLTNQSTSIVSFSHYFSLSASSASRTLTLGSASSQDEAVIDNVRVVHNDIPPYVTMSFSSLKSGTLQLLPGTKSGDYKLTFYVHDDPTADQTGGSGIAHTANRLNPSGITVQVTAAVQSGSTGTYVHFIDRPSGGWPKWTQLSFPMGFNFVNSDADIPSGTSALKIEIAPTNTVNLSTDGKDVGSVLIAQPSFTYNP
jgi:hypothetical protein